TLEYIIANPGTAAEVGSFVAGMLYDGPVPGAGDDVARGVRGAVKGTVGGIKTGTTVLGKYPQYIELAGKLNARRFNIPTNVWNKMTPAEQWAANVKFLDRTIARGDNIILANPVKNINNVSGYFRKELDYLIDNGYKLSKDGTQLIR
ncbi:MAG: hypothetical protein ACLFR2_13195, partial [Candidatus Kapaibacterium sp.]